MSAREEFESWRGGRNINYLDPVEAFVTGRKAGLEAAAKACEDMVVKHINYINNEIVLDTSREECAATTRKLKDGG